MMEESADDWLGYLVLTVIMLILLVPIILVYAGRYRGFAQQPPPVTHMFSSRNLWPFTAGAAGMVMVVILGGTFFNISAAGTPVLWALFWGLIILFGLLAMVSLVTWPRFLAPRWYRDWLDRGGTQQTSVYSPEEHAAGQAKDVHRFPGSDREAGWLLKKLSGGSSRSARQAGRPDRNDHRKTGS